MIILGDFHQFPPVASRANGPLFMPMVAGSHADAIAGRALYEQFTTVVKLRKQVRVEDGRWYELLQNVRYGTCGAEDLRYLRSLVLGMPGCPPTDFKSAPWACPTLITPRHATREQWNAACVRKHCTQQRVPLYICRAEDTVQGRPVSLAQKFLVASKKSRAPENRGSLRAGLPYDVEIAKGMKVMVTSNLHTELDIANGARGIVVDIILNDEDADTREVDGIVKLKRLPTCVLVKLERTRAPRLDGLEKGVVPIFPVTKKFSVEEKGINRTFSRTQHPLTGAYAFTDFRGQGQTIDFLCVDIAPPPKWRIVTFQRVRSVVAQSWSSQNTSVAGFQRQVIRGALSSRIAGRR